MTTNGLMREERGQVIAKTVGAVRRIDEHSYEVKSQTSDAFYQIISTEFGWACSCPDNQYREMDCKHIFAVRISFALRQKVKSSIVIQPINIQACPKCNSESIKKAGIRHNQAGDIQRFACKACGYWFTVNLGFEKMKSTPQTVTMAMQLYFSGLSFESTAKALKLKGVKISNVGVYKWVKKYVGLMEKYVDQITPQVGDTWRTDEMYVKIRGNMRYLFGMMDDDTRFRIAQQVAPHKGTSDVRPMFKAAMEKADKKPKVLISDGANNFHEAWRKEMWSEYGEEVSPKHIREIRMEGVVHNNKMERQNGEWRDREKTMRSLKNEDSPVIAGMQIFHNFVRPHMGLKGKTPAEAAGIKVEGENTWITLIQNASKRQMPTVNGSEEMPES
jgi:transposase-like protein